ncbi:MAG: CRISPR-associated endonuclease Cas2 [Candidatus Taylorbacteria bacterium RIFCSPLOWO2_02_FULL_43_11]|uniref:CRISPR-associated endoribonuclease Cas2 n=1 Tax=Candidatus Taylorbacteria bacterium RIFCSPHIGHO2_02_FULL_43_32b TaxID=1802306 RepID=A0A1G2MFI6_9BACT|nr:MAG: CRISPR-associated endonuclease Cas2 [Candidatus Taylorbacteria bacterium RIFCSPHIGHO2_01_FULL_43_47]OHA22685.1 MAG: CRISPR-associated endonuclease Cas2 [Candidatus Taylorbacteria bacterium RIFCSPHIGHO2_02_FULL_43_32b]OHA29645.1 MAG: CRISPR-associated endonuclease Cas2 [Candidatus Taylorbacteria bacterium RIFCSPLOWO2_01_FULL_43_44]OHA36105.1 MAG: CRISPR-associated endonuclease Cas2 [Candidatus Taylorbacteria bacterium RIFCSPLOWO2_02_FULL_43_11]
MGELEKDIKVELKRKRIKKAILYSIAAAGFLSVALLAPNALQMLSMFDQRKKKNGRTYNLKQTLDRLLYNELVVFEDTPKGKFLKLTKKGEREARYLEVADRVLQKPKKWDKKWRVIIFDVNESKRTARNKLRRTLSNMGFVKLQKSVWVYPYDCEDLVTLLKLDLKMGRDVTYMIVDRIENDKLLRKYYGLADASK